MRVCPSRWIGFVLAAGSLLAGEPAGATEPEGVASLAGEDRHVLVAGGRVERPLWFARRGGQYVGGVSYQVLRSPPEQVLQALLDFESFAKMLPRTRSARLISTQAGQSRVELRQGRSPFIAEYTVVIERASGLDEVRFWLDRGYAHDIEDVWGFFRVQPFGANGTLLSVGVAVDLGPGLARAFFEERVQALILSAPTSIRDFMEPGRLAAVDRSILAE